MSVIRTTTCTLCGVALEVRRMRNLKGIWRETPAMAILPGPNDPNGHWGTCCEPGGPGHEEAK